MDKVSPTPRRTRRIAAAALSLVGLLVFGGAASAECPFPEAAQNAPVVQVFNVHLQQHYPMLRNDPSLTMEDRLILIGHALGRQALAVGDDPDRRAAFDCLMLSLEQNQESSTLIGGPLPQGGAGFRTIYAAAMGLHDGRVEEITGYTAATPLPTVYGDPPVAADAGTTESSQPESAATASAPSSGAEGDDASQPTPEPGVEPEEAAAWIEERRDELVAEEYGPLKGPNGDRWAPQRPSDFVFAVVPWPGVDCWSFDDLLWCNGGSSWSSVGYTDGDGWAMASLRNEPPCTFITEWRTTGDDGLHRFGGTMTCADGRSAAWNVLVK